MIEPAASKVARAPAQTAEKALVLARAAFEISPLFEEFYSGIPIVTAQITRYCLNDPTIDWVFLYGSIIVPRELVELMLVRRSGAALLDNLTQLAAQGAIMSLDDARRRACIWPNVKSMSEKFAHEAFIIHDLSTLLTPQYHHPDSIRHHANRIVHDCTTSEHVFCVSEATRQDAIHYLGLTDEATSVLPLGVEYDQSDLYAEAVFRNDHESEPYLLVLNTIEPRKNGSLVVEMIARNPEIANAYRIIFVGRDGWLDEKERLIARLRQAGIDPGRVIFSGFISDRIKLRLLMNCAFAIYPSFFEGYGLPVLEATVLGKLCVASKTSSIIEVAPEHSLFFDPTDADDLARATRKAIALTQSVAGGPLSFDDLQVRVSAKGWWRTYDHIRTWVLSHADIRPTIAEPVL